MTFEELCYMREGVAKEYGIQMWRQYSEPQAAHIMDVPLDTLKELRAEGKTPFVSLGPRRIRYLGLHICDIILFGLKWQDTQREISKLAPSGLVSEKEAPRGMAPTMTNQPSAQDALALARMTIKKPPKR